MIAEPDQYTAEQTVEIADRLNEALMPSDIVVLEDHPEIEEKVKHVRLNEQRRVHPVPGTEAQQVESFLEDVGVGSLLPQLV